MIGAWVLIFVQVTGIFTPSFQVQPIYFQTKEACDAVALEFNNGQPEPSKDKKVSVGAICRATGAK